MGLRTILTAAATTGLGLLLAVPADAQEVLTREESTLELVIGGELSMGYTYRGEMFDAIFPRNGLPATGRRSAKAETFTNLKTTIFMDFTLKDAVGVFVELTTGADAYGGESHRFGDNAQDVQFEQVKAYAQDVFVDRLEVAVGVQHLSSNFRATRSHGQFFLDIHNSENPFSGAVHNWATTGGALNGLDPSGSGLPTGPYGIIGPVSQAYGGAVVGDGAVSEAGWNPYMGGNAWLSNWAGQSKESEFGGIVTTYSFGGESNDATTVRAYLGTTFESGTARQDTQVTGADFTTRFTAPSGAREQGSSIGINYTYLSAGVPIGIHSFGLSLDFWLLDDMVEVYSEYVGQFGIYTDGSRPAGGRSHTNHAAYGLYAGGRVELPLNMLGLSAAATSGEVVFLDVSWWNLTGDKGNPFQSNNDYVSFESVESSLILEGARYGFDIDTNYWALKSELGIETSWGSLSIFYGSYRLLEKPVGNSGSSSLFKERLGNELDIRLRLFQPIENVEIGFAAAFLFDANYFNSVASFYSGNPARPGRAGTSEQLYVAEVKIKF